MSREGEPGGWFIVRRAETYAIPAGDGWSLARRRKTVAQAACLPYREPPACHAEAGSKPAIRQTGSLRHDEAARAAESQAVRQRGTKYRLGSQFILLAIEGEISLVKTEPMKTQPLHLLVSAALLLAVCDSISAAENAPAPKPKAARAPNPSLVKVEDVAGLPRVLLIGDSISMGYTVPVRELLTGKANLHRIPTNGGPTTNGIKNLKDWLGASKWDVIHFNWGLHDVKFILDDPSKRADPKTSGAHRQVSIEDYEKNLRELVAQLKATGAKLIWCSTTPVPEGSDGRVAGDELKYNEVAARVMKDAGIPTDDLYTHAKAKLAEIQLPNANVHYSEAGYKFLAEKVAAEIESRLPKK